MRWIKGKEIRDWFIVGSIAGVLSVILLWSLNKLPTLQVTMATYAVDLTQEGTISSGIGKWLINFIGVTMPTNFLVSLIVVAISGSIIFIIGRQLFTWLSFGIRNRYGTLVMTMLYGSIVTSLIVNGFSIISGFGNILRTFIVLGVYALALSAVIVIFEKNKWIKLPA